jgi:hypothetical protein
MSSGSGGRDRLQLDDITISSVEVVSNTVATPQLSPAGGQYLSSQNVTLSTATEGASIYYTTDGSNPDATDNLYSSAIAVSSTTMIKAIAIKDGMDNSSIASATYTFPTNLANLAALRASTADGTTRYKVTGEVFLTFKQAFRNQKWVQDGTAGMLIDDNSAVYTTVYNVNDGITGIIGTLSSFSGQLQFVPVAGTDPGAATSTNNVITPQVITLNDFVANYEDYESELVTIKGVRFITDATTHVDGDTLSITDGTATGNYFRNTFFGVSHIGSSVTPYTFDLTGIANERTSAPIGDFISPRSSADFNVYATSLTTTAGWRMMSSPVSTTYGTLLAPGWTQGITGSDSPSNGTANVFTFTSGAFAPVENMTNAITPGSGFIYYHFGKDNYTTPNSGPTTFGVTGTENGAVSNYALATGSVSSTEGWTLMGNPFASTINWGGRTTTGTVNSTVYVYTSSDGDELDQNENPRYDSWNGSAGNLASGRIAPFQGFFVKADAASSTLSIPLSAKSTTAGSFRQKENVDPSFVIRLSDGKRTSDAWFSFTETGAVGMDAQDAYKLDPLDGTFISVFSTINGTPMDIQNLPASLNERLEIPVSVKSMKEYAGVDGDFTISLQNLEGIQDSWGVSLLDNETNTEVDLRSASHSFRWSAPREKMRPATERVNNPVMTTAAATAPRFTLIIDPASSTSTKDDGRGTMDEFALSQNYPNPFNPSTQIRFTLQSSDVTRLTVYDVLGREVAVLVNGTLAAGAHSVTFDASNLTSGVYMYKLEAGGMTMTKRMTLVK